MRQGTPRPGPRRTNESRIAQARRAAGLTQGQLADRLGVVPQMIGKWERDERHAKIETLQKIARALDIPLSQLKVIE